MSTISQSLILHYPQACFEKEKLMSIPIKKISKFSSIIYSFIPGAKAYNVRYLTNSISNRISSAYYWLVVCWYLAFSNRVCVYLCLKMSALEIDGKLNCTLVKWDSFRFDKFCAVIVIKCTTFLPYSHGCVHFDIAII